VQTTATGTERVSRRRGRAIPVLVALGFVAVACGGSDSTDRTEPSSAAATSATTEAATVPTATTTTATTIVEADPIVIGLVAPSARDDASFTQSMVDSLDRLADERPLEFEVVGDLPTPEEALPVAEAFAADGADLVIVHGSQYRSVIERVAADHPAVTFAWGTAADDLGLANVFAYSAAADEGGYVNGVIAAGLSESKMIGVIGPIQLGDAGLYIDGFRLGAMATDPAVEVNVSVIDSYTDAVLAGEAATVMTGFGADVLTSTSQISAGPLDVATQLGVSYLGTQSSPAEIAPAVVAAAQVYHWEIALAEMLEAIDAAAPGRALQPLTLANGGLTIDFNEDFEMPPEVRSNADAAIAALTDGSLVTGLD
jgi:basic membrane protein A